MTSRFVSAAKMMAKVLGMPGYKFVVTDHPISNASDAQLAAYARAAHSTRTSCNACQAPTGMLQWLRLTN